MVDATSSEGFQIVSFLCCIFTVTDCVFAAHSIALRISNILPRLPVKVKSSADHVVLYLCQSLLRHLLPECIRRRVWRLFYSRSTLLVSNLPGPDCVELWSGLCPTWSGLCSTWSGLCRLWSSLVRIVSYLVRTVSYLVRNVSSLVRTVSYLVRTV